MVAFLDVIACGFGAVVLIILIAPVGEFSPTIETTIFKNVHSLKEQISNLETDLALAGVEINARKKNVAQFNLLDNKSNDLEISETTFSISAFILILSLLILISRRDRSKRSSKRRLVRNILTKIFVKKQ